MKTSSFLCPASALVALLFACSSATAATSYTWTGGTSGSWNTTAANWNSGSTWVNGGDAYFPSFASFASITLTTDIVANAIYTTSGSQTVAFNQSGGTGKLDVTYINLGATGSAIDMFAEITGNHDLHYTSGGAQGALNFKKSATYTGDTYLSGQAYLTTTINNALPTTTTLITDSGTTYRFATGNTSQEVAGLSGGGTVRAQSAGTNTFSINTKASTTTTFSGILNYQSGSTLNLEVKGSGTQILSGSSSTLNGSTTVSGGTLLLNNSTGSALGTSNAAVNGGTLGGTGKLTGTITVNSGGTLAPGASIQSMGSGALTLNNGSTFAFEVDSGAAPAAAADLQVVSGGLSLNNTVTLTLANLSAGTFAEGTTLTLINYNGVWNGGIFTYSGVNLTDERVFTFNGQNWKIDYDATSGGSNFSSEYLTSSNFVNITAVPEPSAWLLAIVGLVGAVVFRGRRKNARLQ